MHPERRIGTVASESGFSLIELLVVILIIGLLAAIAIPRFINQQEKAHGSQAKAAAHTAVVAMQAYATSDGHSGFDGATVPILRLEEPTLADADLNIVGTPTDEAYQLNVVSKSASNPVRFTVQRISGTTLRTCTLPNQGDAPADIGGCNDGNW